MAMAGFFNSLKETFQKFVQSKSNVNQPSQEKPVASNSGHFKRKPDASFLKASSPRKETVGTISGWSPSDLEVFKHPMCLISTESVKNEEGKEVKIKLNSEQEVFEQIKQIEFPLVVVAVVGLYRTGKSYLMNCLADSNKGGFALGNTIESKTKGIWVWCTMHPKKRDTVLVLLDTEGLGDVDKGDQNHDNKIFTLATLLCNCLIYNMKGAFDNEAVSKLTFVTEMAKNITYRGKSSEDNEMLNLILPDFVLCVRDFTLELKKDGKAITTDQYLEGSLAENKTKDAKFNKPRKCIKQYFPKRSCFVFPMPGDTSVIKNLERLTLNELCEDFKKATSIFLSYIYDIQPKDMLGSKPINGEMFVTLAERYVTAIQRGAVPDVDDAFTAAAKIENAKIENQAVEIFKKMVNVNQPVPGHVLRRHYTNAQQAALEFLRQNAVHDLKFECENQAQMKMDKLWMTIKESNDTKVQEMCEKTLKDNPLKRSIEEKIKNKDYETAGGYRKFQRDFERLRNEYFSSLHNFEENEILRTWFGFMKSTKQTEANIVEADENLSEKEKKDEQRRNLEYIEQLLKEQQTVHQDALERQKQDLDDHYERIIKDRDKQLAADEAKYKALLDLKLAKEAAEKEIKRYRMEQEKRRSKWVLARIWSAIWNDY